MTTAPAAPSSESFVTDLTRRGMMFVLSAPPGGGKTTISRALLEDPYTDLSVSATTREKRPGEEEGVHYYFVSEEKFKQMADAGEMLEHVLAYNGYYYGTPKAPVEKALAAGRDVLFDIDWQGMRKLKAMAPDDVVSLFILPPTWQELSDRLHNRARDSKEEIERRLSMAADEISHYKEFDYLIVNNDLEKAIARTRAILEAERYKRRRLTNLEELVDQLVPESAGL